MGNRRSLSHVLALAGFVVLTLLAAALVSASVDGYACGSPGPNSGPCDAQNRPYFRPANLVTRGQAAKIVGNAFFPNCQAVGD